MIEITGVDHIYLTVSDLKRSEAFYDSLMRLFGFKKGTAPIGGEPHCHYYNRELAISIRPARPGNSRHNPYAPGLHHLCLRATDNASVDAAATVLDSLGIAHEGPRLWPEYAPDYYAVFFSDPDGIRLEVMNFREGRKQTRAKWDQLVDFENPFDRLIKSQSK
jgi:glyoxylase I family protein